MSNFRMAEQYDRPFNLAGVIVVAGRTMQAHNWYSIESSMTNYSM